MKSTLTLVIPDLLDGTSSTQGSSTVGAPYLPGWELIKARAKCQTAAHSQSKESLALQLFGIESDEEYAPPIAPITHLIDLDAEHDGAWMRADPVYLRPDLHDLKLFDASSFSIDRAESEQLVSEINSAIGSPQWQLVVGNNSKRWYLKLPNLPKLRTFSPNQAAGKDVDPYLPGGADAAQWHCLANEIQMLMHSSDVNVARGQRGDVPINSVWFWGAGHLPAKPSPVWQHICSNNTITQGLAVLGGISLAEVPSDANQWANQWLGVSAKKGNALVYLDEAEFIGVDNLAQPADFSLWLEKAWFAPLLDLIRERKLETLTVITLHASMTLTRRMLKRFWLRPAPKRH